MELPNVEKRLADARGAALAAEFAVFARYLGARNVSDRLSDLYVRMHAAVGEQAHASVFDRRLVALARWGPFWAGTADAYARVARPYGTLRRKLVLTLSLLESSAETHVEYDSARPAPFSVTWVVLAALGVSWVARALLAAAVVGPLHLMSRSPNEAPRHG
jgi:hypothetical protein